MTSSRPLLQFRYLALSHVVDILAHSAGVPLDAYPVSRMVNKLSVDSKELIQPIA